jgi:hypothetical protein
MMGRARLEGMMVGKRAAGLSTAAGENNLLASGQGCHIERHTGLFVETCTQKSTTARVCPTSCAGWTHLTTYYLSCMLKAAYQPLTTWQGLLHQIILEQYSETGGGSTTTVASVLVLDLHELHQAGSLCRNARGHSGGNQVLAVNL